MDSPRSIYGIDPFPAILQGEVSVSQPLAVQSSAFTQANLTFRSTMMLLFREQLLLCFSLRPNLELRKKIR